MRKSILIGLSIALFSCGNNKQPPVTEQASVPPVTTAATSGPQVMQQPIHTDTVRLLITKQDGALIVKALKAYFPTPANSQAVTIGEFQQSQSVFNYLAGEMIKKWPDLNPKLDTTKKVTK